MAADVMGFDDLAIHEAASAGLKGMERLIRMLSDYQGDQPTQFNCGEITDFTVSRFKNVVSILNRTGHARFRRGPSNPTESIDLARKVVPAVQNKTGSQPSSPAISAGNLTFAGEGSISTGKEGQKIQLRRAVSSGKPPLPSSHRKRCNKIYSSDRRHSLSASGGCHCHHRRKSGVKKVIKVLTTDSEKKANIPADEYSWTKYAQKLIQGLPLLRCYYKCSSYRGCPARKHVERAQNNPMMLVITYEGEHRHASPPR